MQQAPDGVAVFLARLGRWQSLSSMGRGEGEALALLQFPVALVAMEIQQRCFWQLGQGGCAQVAPSEGLRT